MVMGFKDGELIGATNIPTPTDSSVTGNDGDTVLLIIGDGTHESTTFNDLSASDHTVTGNGHVKHMRTLRHGNVSSMYFDEVEDYLTIPNHADFNLGAGDYTVEAWIYYTDVPSSTEVYRIMAQGELEDHNGDWCFGFGHTAVWGTGVRMNLAIRSGGSTTDYVTPDLVVPTFVKDSWHHLAISRASGTLKFFYNGAEVHSVSDSLSMTSSNSSEIMVGARTWDAGNRIEELQGFMDEIRVSKVARYTADFTPVMRHNDYAIESTVGGNTYQIEGKLKF
jgi:hypothetical protein